MYASYVVPGAFFKKCTQNPLTEREIIKKCLETVGDVAVLDTRARARAIITNERFQFSVIFYSKGCKQQSLCLWNQHELNWC